MKSVHFIEDNAVLASGQEKFTPLPCRKDEDLKEYPYTVRYKFTIKERLRALLFGELWYQQQTQDGRFNPVFLTLKKSEVLIYPKVPLHLRIKFFYAWHFRNTNGELREYITKNGFDPVSKNLYARDPNLALEYFFNCWKKSVIFKYLNDVEASKLAAES